MGTLRADAAWSQGETGKVVQSYGRAGQAAGLPRRIEQKLSANVARLSAQATAATVIPEPATARSQSRPAAKQLATKLALRYSKALDAKDSRRQARPRGARRRLKEQPDFRCAVDPTS